MEMRPLSELHFEGQREWIGKHRYYMGIEGRCPIPSNNASADFIFGNDHFYDEEGNREPSPNFPYHKSSRGLTWENEYNIAFWNEYIAPRIESGVYALGDESFIEKRRLDMEKRELFGYEPLLTFA
ncbi:hypothetical protein J4477_03085 [Candidatus Pacearchaeota archaeon]|nr:hypothetical protein [uncultured archaeon]MBS3072791.1 hypothetical protein [Candidatus Pacearchaeota archaeon]